MRIMRWAAAAATILMSLMNLPFIVTDGGAGFPLALNAVISLLGVVGIVSAIGMLRGVPWGRVAVLAVGVINFAAAVAGLVTGMEGAVIGLVVSGAIVVFGALTPSSGSTDRASARRTGATDPEGSPS